MGGAQQVFGGNGRPERGRSIPSPGLTALPFPALKSARLPHPSSSTGGQSWSRCVLQHCLIDLP